MGVISYDTVRRIHRAPPWLGKGWVSSWGYGLHEDGGRKKLMLLHGETQTVKQDGDRIRKHVLCSI